MKAFCGLLLYAVVSSSWAQSTDIANALESLIGQGQTNGFIMRAQITTWGQDIPAQDMRIRVLGRRGDQRVTRIDAVSPEHLRGKSWVIQQGQEPAPRVYEVNRQHWTNWPGRTSTTPVFGTALHLADFTADYLFWPIRQHYAEVSLQGNDCKRFVLSASETAARVRIWMDAQVPLLRRMEFYDSESKLQRIWELDAVSGSKQEPQPTQFTVQDVQRKLTSKVRVLSGGRDREWPDGKFTPPADSGS